MKNLLKVFYWIIGRCSCGGVIEDNGYQKLYCVNELCGKVYVRGI